MSEWTSEGRHVDDSALPAWLSFDPVTLTFAYEHPKAFAELLDRAADALVPYLLEQARSGADVLGVVSFHGGLDSPNPADGKNITAKVLVLHGADAPLELFEQGLVVIKLVGTPVQGVARRRLEATLAS